MFLNRTWGVRHLLAGWGGYWCVLAGTTLAAPLRVLYTLTQQPDGTASANVGFDNDVFKASLTSYGKTVWSGSASLLVLTLWVFGPPLLMWLAWVVTRSRARNNSDATLTNAALGDTVVRELQEPRTTWPADADAVSRVPSPIPAPRQDHA